MIELNKDYTRDTFLSFLKDDFLPDFTQDIREVKSPISTSFTEVHYLGESQKLDLQVFEFTYEGSINKRVALTKDAFSIMKTTASYRALAIFKTNETKNWRLSLMTANPIRGENGKIFLNFSNPRRLSFLLGPEAKTNTPTKFLIKLGKIESFENLQNRFSIEIVNKEFFNEISQAFLKLSGTFLKLPSNKDSYQTKVEFAVRLIGRIIFCWFLREKKSSAKIPLMPLELLSLTAVTKNSKYYHTILEPIFFEVLNMHEKFRKREYTKEPYSYIPYLNGGLFAPQDDDFYFDSNEMESNTVEIPDNWFQDFFSVLETYNFTIDENTSYDEELSIDPEMLGRIFENLLAEINPETGESARKSTGSYYTPKSIVDYMVDETLFLYLKKQTRINDKKLRAAITYDLNDDIENEMTEEEREVVIDALDHIKILDPACGSGAFPIGALQKIVHILQQLDPNGRLWFEKQQISIDPEFRRFIEIKFTKNELDFIRKIGVIKNSIYGVDIQQIASEISRLRCFLTLIVDEQIEDESDNRGIQPLPNLDFKFITANSLLGLPKSQGLLSEFEDKTGIETLKWIRDEYFTSSGIERANLMSRFYKTQKEIGLRLESTGGNKFAEMSNALRTWDPFSHKSATWFDPEWMFGVKNGFDIVIANPPYIREKNNKHIFDPINNSAFGKKYHQGKMDFWYYFLHKAIDIVCNEGNIAFITSRYWLNSMGAKKLIKRISEELSFSNFVDIGKLKVFNDVAGQHMVAIYEKSKNIDTFIYKKLEHDLSDISKNYNTENITTKYIHNNEVISRNNEIILEPVQLNSTDFVELKTIFDVSVGIQESPDKVSLKNWNNSPDKRNIKPGDGVFVLTKEEVEKLNLNDIEMSVLKKYLDPNDVSKYAINWSDKYIIYADKIIKKKIAEDNNYKNLKAHLDKYNYFITSSNKPYGLHRPREIKYFELPKIIFKGMFVENEFTLDMSGYYTGFSFSLIIQKDIKYSLKYLLAILNSEFALDWFKKYGKRRGAGVDIGVEKLRLFPIKSATFDEQKPLIELVDKIIKLTSINKFPRDNTKNTQINQFQSDLNKLVNALYGLL